ncbi:MULTISPECIES: alpha/beta hydrolase family protein [Chryseobacterium]|uniref:Pimeloyl-ACP methyl ester carboxylesterase n=1 Tax=Chryseobacterium camelliae TaxID=1265445 RepID=A0ABU0TI07_9FLAO|nr:MULTISPECIES: alpha/beta hydrolase [Chryseobacterium]MDT3409448.1 pimeloyl-ACP methyl ester carboxylesterase [Pseudacidovorax intermedius]MDQ1096687.1 pimeloyl-ACP methyl ester carboxylesterase [Chryseobacterium camelliae]MDQ1100631.1 pimeloyl-ACP methyl ester carboxylesterase [Chryseobacterium sp. SORGH_AS_1048]MDR6087969.1 pimeloyl-ACP methyl ester carboxylesterase [Chryseobacterium sp. SORGH_AS_0909]MDR6132343.1 pimeloyl-ACP methyl ester carboxylesterase [Chryseobacterium sp. SORGH_AS_11
MKLHFNDQAFSFELLRAVTYAGYQGASIGEALATANRIKEGDFNSWFEEWEKTARRIERIANHCLEGKHTVSAGEAYLRAHNYYRTAEFFLDGTDPRRIESFGKSVYTFEKAMALYGNYFERVAIPYENTFLKGYFYGVLGYDPDKPLPTLVFIGGYDSTLQELYFCGAAPAIKRGYNCLIFELPGQGEALRKQNLTMRYDTEVPVGAALDFVQQRKDVDMEKLALLGMSLGGYFAPRAAAFDHRIKAVIAFNVFYDIYESILNQNPQLKAVMDLPDEEKETVLANAEENNSNLRWMLNNGKWVYGLKHRYQVFDEMKRASLRGVAEKIQCPVLLTMGESDHFVSEDQLQELIHAIQSPKTIRIFTKEEGAEEHCQEGSHELFHQVMFDWLDDTFWYYNG